MAEQFGWGDPSEDPGHLSLHEDAPMSTPLIDCVVRTLQQSAVHKPLRVMTGGSEAKQTAVEGSDIDIVVVLDDFKPGWSQRTANMRWWHCKQQASSIT
jgi:hypothetical protein